ncbi:hypothetical protein WEH80_10975 [Actinomycetes bacterium KLBMP 9759]
MFANVSVPVLPVGIRPPATSFGGVGIETASEQPIVSVTWWIHLSCTAQLDRGPVHAGVGDRPAERTGDAAVSGVSGWPTPSTASVAPTVTVSHGRTRPAAASR